MRQSDEETLSLMQKQRVVLEPDPGKNRKKGLGDRLRWKCTVRLECRQSSEWFMIACLHMFNGNTHCNPLV